MLFRDIPIGQAFGWRHGAWVKIDRNHAVPAGSVPAEPEFVPSHDNVTEIDSTPAEHLNDGSEND